MAKHRVLEWATVFHSPCLAAGPAPQSSVSLRCLGQPPQAPMANARRSDGPWLVAGPFQLPPAALARHFGHECGPDDDNIYGRSLMSYSKAALLHRFGGVIWRVFPRDAGRPPQALLANARRSDSSCRGAPRTTLVASQSPARPAPEADCGPSPPERPPRSLSRRPSRSLLKGAAAAPGAAIASTRSSHSSESTSGTSLLCSWTPAASATAHPGSCGQ